MDIYDGQDVADELLDWANDYFSKAPTWDEPFGSGSWHHDTTNYGADYEIVLPLSYANENDDMIEWLDKLSPSMYRGDNGDLADAQSDVNGWLEGAGYGDDLECVKFRFQRMPAGQGEDTETVYFYPYIKVLASEE